MVRPRRAPGTLGAVSYRSLATGEIQARARLFDDAGNEHRPAASGPSEQIALERLLKLARTLSTGAFGDELSPDSTIAEATALWLSRNLTRGIAQKSIESYEDTARLLVLPFCGAIRLGGLTVARADRIIQGVLAQRSPSAARKLRAALSQIVGLAVRQGVLTFNPIRDVERLPGSEKKESALSPTQLHGVIALVRGWRGRSGPPPDSALLEDIIHIILGTSTRVGEIVALRRCDVDMSTRPPTVLIAATLIETRKDGLTRKPTPKHARQRRSVPLPSFAAIAIQRRLDLAHPEPTASLFPTATGAPKSMSNIERLFGTFATAHVNELATLGIERKGFAPHLFRRTTATLVEREGGITLTSRLLGHSTEATTRASYVVTAESVSSQTASILDAAMAR